MAKPTNLKGLEMISVDNMIPDTTSNVNMPNTLSNNTKLCNTSKDLPKISIICECAPGLQTGAVKRNYDHVFKIVMVGEPGVGKTSLARRFVKDTFDPNSKPTINIDFQVRVITKRNKLIKVQLWDTAGNDTIHNILPNYFRSANAIVLVCDNTDVRSIRQLPLWCNIARTCSETCCIIYIMITKCDLESDPGLYKEVKSFSETENLQMFATSARNGSGVESAFMDLISMLERRELRSVNASNFLLSSPSEQSSPHFIGCCGIYFKHDTPALESSVRHTKEPPGIIPRRRLQTFKKLPSTVIPSRDDEDYDKEEERSDSEWSSSSWTQKQFSVFRCSDSVKTIYEDSSSNSDNLTLISMKHSSRDVFHHYPIARAQEGAVASTSDATKVSHLSLPEWMRSRDAATFDKTTYLDSDSSD